MATNTYPLAIWDYVVFSVFLVVAVVTGLYHGVVRGGQRSTQQFFLANRSIFSLPVAMTLLASFISPVSLLGNPAETFIYGGLYIDVIFGLCWLYPLIAIIYVPVFYGLEITSANEYLQLRFDVTLRIIGAAIFFLQTTVYMAIVTYSPALAIEAVTDFELWKTILIMGSLCTLYTTLGGMKAVIWTDVFMFLVMFGTLITVLIMGCNEVGGFTRVWNFNKDQGRMDLFYFPKDLTARMSFPSMLVGGCLNNLALWAVSQTSVQRMLAAKSLRDAKMSVWLNLPFIVAIKFILAFTGLVIYTYYYADDTNLPERTTGTPTFDTGCFGYGVVQDEGARSPPNYTKSDQILIYYISEQFGHIPGYQGLFIACIFASTLSTVSSGLNAMVAVTLVDIIRPIRAWRKGNQSKKTTHRQKIEKLDRNSQAVESDKTDILLTKVLTAVFGAIAVGMAFLSTEMGSLVSISYSVFGAVGGPLVGAFSLGMLWKRANAKGTLLGVLLGSTLGIWITIGTNTKPDNPEDVFPLYKLSFMWYGFFTILTTLLIGIISSELVRLVFMAERDQEINPMLLATFLRPKIAEKMLITEEIDGVRLTTYKHTDGNDTRTTDIKDQRHQGQVNEAIIPE